MYFSTYNITTSTQKVNELVRSPKVFNLGDNMQGFYRPYQIYYLGLDFLSAPPHLLSLIQLGFGIIFFYDHPRILSGRIPPPGPTRTKLVLGVSCKRPKSKVRKLQRPRPFVNRKVLNHKQHGQEHLC